MRIKQRRIEPCSFKGDQGRSSLFSKSGYICLDSGTYSWNLIITFILKWYFFDLNFCLRCVFQPCDFVLFCFVCFDAIWVFDLNFEISNLLFFVFVFFCHSWWWHNSNQIDFYFEIWREMRRPAGARILKARVQPHCNVFNWKFTFRRAGEWVGLLSVECFCCIYFEMCFFIHFDGEYAGGRWCKRYLS